MNFANPYLFDAILDGIPHRFVLVQECEYLQGHDGFSPPRFSVGAVNATRDPRYSAIRQLMEVGVSDSALEIPPSWLMAHQYIYILHEYTDEFGWQYRSQWSALGPPGPKDEPWTPAPTANSRVRRRIWLTTIVPKYELVRAKRLLAENLRIDYGNVKLQGELYRYEKGTLNRSWNKRRFILYHNRIEIYTSSTKKTEVLLQDCEVKMLPDGQIAGAKNVFVVRNLSGTVNMLLSAEDQNIRREWVFAIQYQLAMNTPDVNFVPLEYSPPTGDYPDNRVLVASDLKLQSPDGRAYERSFQLLPREVVYYDGDDLRGRIFVEKATVAAEERNLNFSLTTQSGITLNLAADSPEQKNMWILSVRKQVQHIDAYNTMKRNLPREEQEDPSQPPVDRISQFYDGNWGAPPVAGEDEEYIRRIFTAPYENHPDHFEFSEELDIRFDKKHKPEASTFKVDVQTRAHTTELIQPSINKYKSMQIITEDLADIKEIVIPAPKLDKAAEVQNPTLNKIKELVIPDKEPLIPASSANTPTITPALPQSNRSLARLKTTMSVLNMSGVVKYLNVKRILINPRFMLAALKGITHRFVLVMESENRISAPRDIQDTAPLRFTVGGSRASKDPRMVRFDQLIGISNKNPEVQLPPGWFMLHQYVNIIQSNTDDYGWQYRSTWSEGTLNATDEQWVDGCDEQKQVRRRLWMTTVVKRDDFIKAKKMVTEELMKAPDDFILKEDLYLHDPEKGTSATSWQRRNVILYHNKVEFYSGNEKVNDVSLVDCDVKVLAGADAGGRSFPFCIYHPNGSINVKLDATDKDMRLRWMRALLYQLAVITPEVNFSPFVFGPPTGELSETRILLCGDLEVLDNATNTWDLYQIQLQEQVLLVLHRDAVVHGRLLLDHAVVKAREDECEFTVKTQDGLVIHFRAINADTKFSWVRILKRQIPFAEYAEGRKAIDESSIRTQLKQFQDADWIGREGEYGEDDAHMRSIRQNYKEHLVSMWSGERGSENPTASSIATEHWRITQQTAAIQLNANSVTSDATHISKFSNLSQYAETDITSQSTEPAVKTVTRLVRTTTTTTMTNNTTNVVTDDGKGTRTVVTGTASSKDVVEAVQKQVNGSEVENTVRSMHTEVATGAPIAPRTLPIPPNLLSQFGKTKSSTSSSVPTADSDATAASSVQSGSLPSANVTSVLNSSSAITPEAPVSMKSAAMPALSSSATNKIEEPIVQQQVPVTAAQEEGVKKVTIVSPKVSVASTTLSAKTNEFDDLDEILNLRKENIEYEDDDDDDGDNDDDAGDRRSPVEMLTSQYFTEEEEDRGEDFEEAAKAVQTMAESNDSAVQDNAQQKLRTLNQMTMAYMRRLGYVSGLSPTHAYIPMNHLNDFDQAYVLENGFFKEGEDNATHAYIPIDALRRSLMSLESLGSSSADDIKKVTLRHVPTTLLIRRGIDKPLEPESELLREARRRAETRREINIGENGLSTASTESGEPEFLREARRRAETRREINIGENGLSTVSTESGEPEFLREARRRQQSRRVTLPEDTDAAVEYATPGKGSYDETEPEFLREAKRRQASRRLVIEAEGNANRDDNINEVENEAVREAKRREQRRRELEEEASRKNQQDSEERKRQEDLARQRAEQDELARQQEKAARIAALEAEVARKKSLDEAAKKQADEELLRKIAEEKARKLLEVGMIDVTAPSRADDRTASGEYDTMASSNAAHTPSRAPSNDSMSDYLSPAGRARLPPASAPSPRGRRVAAAISLSSPASFDLEDELSQVSKRLRPVPGDDMSSVGSHQRDDLSVSSQNRRPVRLKNMSTEYLQRKGYLLPGNDFATIPFADLRSSDQKLVTENGLMNEEGTHAIIQLKNTESRLASQEAESGKLMEQVNLKPVSRDGLPPQRPGMQREDSILKSVQLRPVERRTKDERNNQGNNDSVVSPLVQVKQNLRRVGASNSGDSAEGNDGLPSLASSSRDEDDNSVVSSPFKSVKLRSVKNANWNEDDTSGADHSLTGGIGMVGASVSDDDNNDAGNDVQSIQDLRAHNVRSNSIMGKIQKFEKTPTASSANNNIFSSSNNTTNATSSTSSEVRGISKSTSIAAKRNSEPVAPSSPSASSANAGVRPPVGRPAPGSSSKPPSSPRTHKPPSDDVFPTAVSSSKPPSSPRTHKPLSDAVVPTSVSSSKPPSSPRTHKPPSDEVFPTSVSSSNTTVRVTESSASTTITTTNVSSESVTSPATSAPSLAPKPPNPILQRKRSAVGDKGLGAAKKSFRF